MSTSIGLFTEYSSQSTVSDHIPWSWLNAYSKTTMEQSCPFIVQHIDTQAEGRMDDGPLECSPIRMAMGGWQADEVVFRMTLRHTFL
jgi:hypothetical protein